MGDTVQKMYVRKKKYPSGNIGIIVVEKINGKMNELVTIGIAKSEDELGSLLDKGKEWIEREKERRHPRLDLFGDERRKCEQERMDAERLLSSITNITIDGADLILDRVFDNVGFNRIEDEIFRKLVKARLSYPASKSATVEYLKNHFDEDVSLSKIYRYLDKLSDSQHRIVQNISVDHTRNILGGHIGVLFYDVTTLYFEADYEDELRKTGFSKEGRHKNPQIILGLLVSIGGYPLSYCIHEGNKYEGHTMLPVVTEFVRKYKLEDFIVVADSGLMNSDNIADLEANGYKYIIGSKIKTESKKIKEWILSQPRHDCQMVEYDKGDGKRLLVGYTADRARKDAYNRDKGIRRLEKAYRRGTLTKDHINKRGYNKFLTFIKGSSVSQLPLGSQFFLNIGCSSQEEFLRIYTKETLRRYYDNNDFLMWGKIEKIREYLENTSKCPVDLALYIVECYGSINALKARDFIRHISLTTWTDLQMMASQQDVNELGLRTVSVIVYVYASLYNKTHYPDILKYVEWVEKNIERAKGDKDGIVYNIASALALMDKHKESLAWISKVQVNKSEYKQEFCRLLLENHCELEHTKESLKIASKMNSFSYQDILRLIRIKLGEGKIDGLGDLLSTFTSSLSDDFNLFSLMDSEDQNWSSYIAKCRTKNLWMDMDVSLWIKGEKNGKQALSSVEPYIAAMRYNWALASKGILLRSNKFMRDLILNKMPSELYQYYQHALEFEEEDYEEDNLNRRLNSFVSEQAKAILLDYVRKDTTHILPQFDYNIVRHQLQTGDIAIELVRLDDDELFDVIMIRKDWNFPKYVSLARNDKKDNCRLLWSSLMPYLTNVQRIFISLDGEYHFENIELTTDSIGECMADKYNIYIVSTTLNIPKDVYMSDIKQSVLYGNLKYADSDETDSHGINESVVSTENNKRGAINNYWIPLEDTKEELKAICKILSDMNIQHKEFQEEYGDKMSFMSLNRQKIDLLHLATHVFYYDEDLSDEDKTSAMKRSGIVLSNSAYDLLYKKQSGSIFANEIANMDLNSIKLLVLSACETAQGNLGDDGVFGLQRGFKQAGVGCMIMSLKEVNSPMTTELMQLFYSFFAKGQSVREAFRNAQRQIAAKYNTDDWKSFVIID